MTGADPARRLDRALGCVLGALLGDAYGAQFEFQTHYPARKRVKSGEGKMLASPVWNPLPGQITDDGEMTLCLLRAIATNTSPIGWYCAWAESHPFDMGSTTACALIDGKPNPQSQANGALMRASPLALLPTIADAIREAERDAERTHPNKETVVANRYYAAQLWRAVNGYPVFTDPVAPVDDAAPQGWYRVALRHAYEQKDATEYREAMMRVASHGGDTDTNCAIAGALVGARLGASRLPRDWLEVVESCEPGGHQPRPEEYWAMNARSLVREIVPRE